MSDRDERIAACRAFLAADRLRLLAIGKDAEAAAEKAIMELEPHNVGAVDRAPDLVEILSGDAKIAAAYIVGVVTAEVETLRRDAAERERRDAERDQRFVRELELELGGAFADARRWFRLRRELEQHAERLEAGDARAAVDLRVELAHGRRSREAVRRTFPSFGIKSADGIVTVLSVLEPLEELRRRPDADPDTKSAIAMLIEASLGERSPASIFGLGDHGAQLDGALAELQRIVGRTAQRAAG